MLKLGWKSTGDKDNLKSIAVSTLGAGITTGITTKLNIAKPTTFTDKLTKNAIDSATNTALQSTINGDSFKDTLKHQVVNSLVMTGAEYGANAIGSNYYNGNINKATQLTLHAGLGAVSSKLTGGDYLSGAVSGVVGEVVSQIAFDKLNQGELSKNGYISNDIFMNNRETATQISGLIAGLSAIITAKSQGKDLKDISNEAFAGQRVGENASRNNNLAFQVDPNGAGGNGHMSGYFQDDEGNWYKYDQGAAENPDSMFKLLTNQALKAGVSVEYVGDKNYEDILKNSDNTIVIKTTPEQDKKISEKAYENVLNPGKYRIYTDNCVDSVQDIFKAGDVKFPLDIDPRPNKYFEKLLKMYPNNNTNSAIRSK